MKASEGQLHESLPGDSSRSVSEREGELEGYANQCSRTVVLAEER